MRLIKFTLFLFMGVFFSLQSANAMIEPTNNAAVIEMQKQKNEELQKNKKYQKFSKKLNKASGIDLSDPVKKWLWFALGFGIASVILSIFFGGLLAGIAWTAAGVCLVIWILKYFGVL